MVGVGREAYNCPVEESLVDMQMTYDKQLSGKWGTGTKLIAAAWLVEIAAASIGLFIALLTIYSARDQAIEVSGSLSFVDNMNSILGGLPFFMVAVIELCKIPLATAYFHAGTRFWRLVFLAGLTFLLVITFETMMNGFERFLTTRTIVLNEARDSAKFIRDDISRIESEITQSSSLTLNSIRDAYQNQVDQIESSRAVELRENASSVANAQETYGKGDFKVIQKDIDAIDRELDRIEKQLQEEMTSVKKGEALKVGSLSRNVEQERVKLRNELKDVKDRLEKLHEAEDAELKETFFLGTDSVKQKFAERRAPLETEQLNLIDQIQHLSLTNQSGAVSQQGAKAIQSAQERYDSRRSQLLKQREGLSSRIHSGARKSAAALKPALQALEKHRGVITKKYDAQSSQARSRFDEQMADLKTREKSIGVLNGQLSVLRVKLQEQRREITRKAQDNQVYRVARWIFDKESAADLTQEEVNTTTLVWFGSLAAITAWTGTLLAFGGLVVKYEHSRHHHLKDQRTSFELLIRSLRRYLIYKRKRAREPEIKIVETEVIRTVEVEKEIPVEKVVLRDVPVEVVRKEIIYLPLLTDEEDLVHKNSSKLISD
jgi:hypothetical protein